jgi:probable addiction module antidote protein
LNESFQEELRDPEFAREFLAATLEEAYASGDTGVFLLALRDVAQACRAMTGAARRAGVSRPNLYRALSEEGNPRFETIFAVLPELGVRLSLEPVPPATGTDATTEEAEARRAQASPLTVSSRP